MAPHAGADAGADVGADAGAVALVEVPLTPRPRGGPPAAGDEAAAAAEVEALRKALGRRPHAEVVRQWRGKVRFASCECFASADKDYNPEGPPTDEEVALHTFCRILTDYNYDHLEVHDFNVGIRVYQRLRLFQFSPQADAGPAADYLTVRYIHHIYEFAAKLYGRLLKAATVIFAPSDQAPEGQPVAIYRQERNTVFHPHFVVFVEPPGLVTRCGGNDVSGRLLHGRVVVTIRGTMSLADALTDVAAEPVRMEVGDGEAVVHQGMMLAATNLFASVRQPILQALAENPSYDLVVTGHSLGGGSAILLTLLMRTSPDEPLRRATCVAFGPPPVLRGAVQGQCDDFIETVVNEDDIVPRLSIPAILYLLQVADYAHSLSWWRQVLLATR
eukprot:EG_transcript_15822